MDEKKMGTQLFVLGRLYRILMDAARDRGANQSELENASHNPLAGIGYAYNLVLKLRKLTSETEKKVSALLEQIDDDLTFEQSPSMEMQYSFMSGYQMGGNGLFEKSKIAEIRKEVGLTQVQLAEKIGVLQKDISRWETGIVKPGAERLKQIAEVLGCKVNDII